MLEIKNVSKTFNLTGNAADTRIALDNISLTINDGEFVTIIGGKIFFKEDRILYRLFCAAIILGGIALSLFSL